MKSILTWTLFLFVLTLVSCNFSEILPKKMDGSAGNSTYYIDNQTGKDLSMTFPISVYTQEKGMHEMDSSIALHRNTRLRFYEDQGHFGLNPHPEMALTSIRFYTHENNQQKLVYEMAPVKTVNWTKHIVSRDKDGIGATDYIFILTPSHLK
ncbi:MULTISPECIES: hypothetical protein [unclassified Siphonobacter]|uniref:hypothetical protein n=1 Tax=unclassified Siphonobacter TaxID=2635712 RepID=UPI0027875A15|nr:MULTISPECIES: hypothetical protein [unclassified Siphonobacter]MDQ1089913.1 hypothetical protein [Siphonobacter sp. SORGH_AS_1065]MDR6197763.1 hypothetical protein [Siphonobacter sp. SORGH_AS_0500]